jgi:glycosyltransferase involved in cell wall biosynthesis
MTAPADNRSRLLIPAVEFTTNPAVDLTIIVPTRHERENIPVLFERLIPELVGMAAEILVVDDSDDDTGEVVTRYAKTSPVPIHLIHRVPDDRQGGLGGAVVAGVRQAKGSWILVMDGDLQHPPASAVMLARAAIRHDVDIVIGTRYAGAGSVSGLNGLGRVLTSLSTTRLAKAAFPRRLATVSDPMSGLFAFRKEAVDLDRLRPIGFKILLEVLVRNPSARVAEMSYEMDSRYAGSSNTGVGEGLRFTRHVLRLSRHRMAGRLRQWPTSSSGRRGMLGRMFGVGLIGLTGLAVNTAALWFCFTSLHMHHLLAAVLATQVSTAWNFVLTDFVLYRKEHGNARLGRTARYFLMNNLLLLLRLPLLQALLWLGVGLLTGNVLSLVVLYLLRFVIVDRLIYGGSRDKGRDPVVLLVDPVSTETTTIQSRNRYQHLTYRYDVAGVVRIGSQIQLPELEFFRAGWVGDDEVDIAVRVGDVGPRGPSRRATMTEYTGSEVPTTLRYEEHLGRLGANFRIELGEPINIEVGPLLARSPHVVYTNILEALLRFTMVPRGRMLLHSASVIIDGVGVMLSALTDTGKTATILRLLREQGGVFLSDDMTIVDAHGNATCFPKPLTISSHTLMAVQATDLTPKEWRRLQWQSRLHSKGGRSIALMLSKFNLPIMGVNAITQLAVPPPKYTVDRLVPCHIGSCAAIEELFIIERGAPRLAELGHAETLEQMLKNTDDAYEFPPFKNLAPTLTIDGKSYQELRDMEKEILSQFLTNVRTRVLASDEFRWADEIPQLLQERSVSDHARIAPGAWPHWGHENAPDGTA